MNPRLVTIILIMFSLTTSCDLTLEVGMEHSPNATTQPSVTPFLTPTLTLTPAFALTSTRTLMPTLQPSQTPLPTTQPTASATATNTPVGQIFRDDFSGSLQPGWTWINEVPDRWTFTPEGWLQIIGQDPSLIRDFQNNLLCRRAPSGDYEISVHLFADPKENFQQATLYLYQDGENYVAINRGYCGPCLTGGSGIFLEYKLSGSVGTYKTSTADPEVYLRLLKQDNNIIGYYALDQGVWHRLGTIGDYIEDAEICLGVSNVDLVGIDADLVGLFDYIEISRP